MKSKSILIASLFAMLLAMATAAVAQSKVDGNWEMSMQGRQGPQHVLPEDGRQAGLEEIVCQVRPPR